MCKGEGGKAEEDGGGCGLRGVKAVCIICRENRSHRGSVSSQQAPRMNLRSTPLMLPFE